MRQFLLLSINEKLNWSYAINDRDGCVSFFLSFVNEQFRGFFFNCSKIYFVRSRSYCSFSIFFVRFFTKRSFIKIVRLIKLFDKIVFSENLFVHKQRHTFQNRFCTLWFRNMLRALTSDILKLMRPTNWDL